MKDYLKLAGACGTAGLVMAISFAYGLDISKEGIALIVLQGFFEGLKGLIWKLIYFLINLGFFIGGGFVSYKKFTELLDEDWETIAVSLLSFGSMFLVYIGMALNSSIQKLGAFGLVADICLLMYLHKEG